jgi:hypothetical protein
LFLGATAARRDASRVPARICLSRLRRLSEFAAIRLGTDSGAIVSCVQA